MFFSLVAVLQKEYIPCGYSRSFVGPIVVCLCYRSYPSFVGGSERDGPTVSLRPTREDEEEERNQSFCTGSKWGGSTEKPHPASMVRYRNHDPFEKHI